jgi:hypothetical protein
LHTLSDALHTPFFLKIGDVMTKRKKGARSCLFGKKKKMESPAVRHKRTISGSAKASPSPLKKRQTIDSPEQASPRVGPTTTPVKPSPMRIARMSTAIGASPHRLSLAVENPIQVVLRIRPLLVGERASSSITIDDSTNSVSVARGGGGDCKTFGFSKVLGQDTT